MPNNHRETQVSGRTLRTAAFLGVGLLTIYVTLTYAAAPSPRQGSWAMNRSDEPGRVQFSMMERHGKGYSNNSSDWPTTAFPGVELSKPGRQEVTFKIVRDAGTIDCEGFLDNGEGAGVFHFLPDSGYPAQMKALGFSVDPDQQYKMAVHDVSLSFAREIKDEHLSNLDADKLTSFRTFGVDGKFIKDLRSAGVNLTDSDQLVAFKIHGVTPEIVQALRQMGYTPDAEALVAMSIHGATPEWIGSLKQLGYDHVDLDDLISFRIHGVSSDFIRQLNSMGYTHPAPEELVSMRIHGVTPEYIADMRSRGMQNLTIDQLISMRIHGVD